MDTIHYSFRYSRLVWIISTLGLAALSYLLYFLLTSEEQLIYELIGWSAVLVLVYPIISMPLSLSYDGERLVLRRLLWSKVYSRADYSIQKVEGLSLEGSLRVFGSGGYFGFSGLFWKPKVGLFKLIQTESSSSYLQITRKGGSRTLYIAYH